ncbi:MAG: hypothetical protein FWD34_00430 [Oscillospiraceae bacterium]|nr:hypothetical protein [Oscillospiraceae bacterium]
MRTILAIIGVAAIAGAGFYIGKKIIEKKRAEEFDDFIDDDLIPEEDPDVFAEASGKCSDGKIRKASMFAVGAIKTGADKFGETIHDIRTKDMVKKGESTVGAVKETGTNIKNDIKKDIDELKNMVSSINDEDLPGAEDLFEEAESVFDSMDDTEATE